MSAQLPQVVRVTAEHIANGKPEDETCCAIALAIKDLAQGALSAEPSDMPRIEVGGGQIWVFPKGAEEAFYATLADEADQFIDDFDSGKEVRPFEFAVAWQAESES